MLGDEIKRAREAQGSTQEQLAQLSGLSLTSIKAYERGKVPCPAAMAALRRALPGLAQHVTARGRRPPSGEWDVAIELSREGTVRVLLRRPRAALVTKG